MLVCENGQLRIGELGPELGATEAAYRAASTDHFRKIRGTWSTLSPAACDNPYEAVLQSFADEILQKGRCAAPGTEGRKSLLLSNAAYLSSWTHRMVEIPAPGSAQERDFEAQFEAQLQQRISTAPSSPDSRRSAPAPLPPC